MREVLINADFSEPVAMHISAMDWQDNPGVAVLRKRLDRSRPQEQGCVTSVVRYDPGSAFHAHPHPDDEEVFVLDRVLADERGDYPAGTFLLNPDGFGHTPFSKGGCILFVKLRQYIGAKRRQVTINMLAEYWRALADGTSSLTLYDEIYYPEQISMMRLDVNAPHVIPDNSQAAKIFSLSGALEGPKGQYSTGDWLRWPTYKDRVFTAIESAIIYLKTGHLHS
ncbi:MAG: cupin domain-containing protein [Rhodospirillaceae bacterium]|nr:cupin domain-containing protein [Rhodospirillaceae bacterium]